MTVVSTPITTVASSDLVYYSVKAVVFVSLVLDNSSGTVSFFEGVRAFDLIAISLLLVLLLVSGVRIVDGIVELVFWISLLKRIMEFKA